MTKPKCALYHRTSTIDQDPTLAREELRRAADVRGLEIVLEVEEQGSGARNDRPGMQKVLAAAQRGKIGAVVVWKLDRFGRSALDLLGNIELLRKAGCRFISATQGLEIGPGGDVMGQLMLSVLAGVAEFERGIIAERTRLGMARAIKEGKHVGRPLGPTTPSATQVKKLRDKGMTWAQLAKTLKCNATTARRVYLNSYQKGSTQPAR